MAKRKKLKVTKSKKAKPPPKKTAKKRQALSKQANKTKTPEEIAEERIAEWIRIPRSPDIEVRKFGAKTGSLDLRDLGLKEVPASIRKLHNIEAINLRRNQIEELPAWIGELTELKGIGLGENRLRIVPSEIGRLSKLNALFLFENQLKDLPKALLALPLRQLHLHGNNALGLPESILAHGEPAEILRYYFESRAEMGTPLRELKLLLVGRGRAGKTTIVKRLAGEEPNEDESETHSIAIRELMLQCPRGAVRTRAWDFGGQEILHSTHQFFLTERSLYLLVLEPRTGSAQRDAEYWLKLIETQGGNSPVIVSMNWSRGRPWRIDEVKLRRKFPFIVDFLSTDALHGDGIEELRRTMLQTVEERTRDVWLPFPKRWREIKDAVAGMRENFLTYKRYSELCMKMGEVDPTAQADLAGYLHTLGLALYFGKDPRLHDTRVLNPGWVTGGVYAVIRAQWVAQHDGQLAVSDMPQVLQDAEEQKAIKAADYPLETHRFILELMRAFQLCYASEEAKDNPGEPQTGSIPGSGTLARIRARDEGGVGESAGALALSL